MTRLQRAALLVSLIDAMRDNESWCGETNVQKATYFLQELLEVPLGFDFVLYKYGPYSFDLAEELTSLRADLILELKVRDLRYGASYVSGEMGNFVIERFTKTIGLYSGKIKFVAAWLGSRRVPELERLATALYVRLTKSSANARTRAEMLTQLKPHVSAIDAAEAVKEIDKMFEKTKQLIE